MHLTPAPLLQGEGFSSEQIVVQINYTQKAWRNPGFFVSKKMYFSCIPLCLPCLTADRSVVLCVTCINLIKQRITEEPKGIFFKLINKSEHPEVKKN